jgi:hypothetical protein
MQRNPFLESIGRPLEEPYIRPACQLSNGAVDNHGTVTYNGGRARQSKTVIIKDLAKFALPPDVLDGTAEVSEREIRDFIKAEIPRWVRNRSHTFVVEEMEVCSGRARIDLALITDQLIGIEIKGPKDDVMRLPEQAKAYSQCFDRVVLVVHENLASKAATLVPDWWGVVVGEQKNCRLRYRFMRRPETNPALNLEVRLALLWRDEIDALLSSLTGTIAKPRATKKAVRAELISQIEPPLLKDASLQKLRERADWRWTPV